MKVPTYEKQVDIRTPKRSLAQAKPAEVPAVLPAAYGADVAKATTNLGNQLQTDSEKVFAHFIKRKTERDLDIGDDLANKFDEFSNLELYSTEPATVKYKDSSGVDQEVEGQKGFLTRQNYAAVGIYKDLSTSLDSKIQQDLDALKDNPTAQRRYIDRVASIKSSATKTALAHEATEVRAGARNILMATLNSETTAIMRMSDTERVKGLENINKTIDRGVDAGSLTFDQGLTAKDYVVDQAFRADTKVYSNEEMTKRVKAGMYPWSDAKQIDTALSTLEHLQNLAVKQAEDSKGFNRLQVIYDVANMSKAGQDPTALVQEASKKDSELAQALQKIVDSDLDYAPKYSDTANRAYSDAVAGIFAGNSPKDISDFIVSESKNIASTDVEKITILLDAALKRAKNLQEKNPAQKEVDKSYNALTSYLSMYNLPGMDAYTSFLTNINAGKTPPEALEAAKMAAAESVNTTGKAYVIGQIITNAAGETGEVVSISPRGVPMIKRRGKKSNGK